MNEDWMPPKAYFLHVVKPTVEEYWAEPRDHRKENAVLQLASFSERFFKYHHQRGELAKLYGAADKASFGRTLRDKLPEYGLIWDSANGAKHHFPDIPNPGSGVVFTATGVWSAEEYELNGRQVTLDQAIRTVYDFWHCRLFDGPGE